MPEDTAVDHNIENKFMLVYKKDTLGSFND